MKIIGNSNRIASFLQKTDEDSMLNFLQTVRDKDLTDNEIINLTTGLAFSGKRLEFAVSQTFDIPSTGGPSSLSTLLCPLFLRVAGGIIVKLAVPGRPAGGIDVLAQINGYKIELGLDEVKKQVNNFSFAHFLGGDVFAPLDSKLFLARVKSKTLNIPSLVISSILSKKISVGVKNVGLDVRVHKAGNFGQTFDDARKNSNRFITIAKKLNLSAKCFLSDFSTAQQPYIGRGESILALYKIFNASQDRYLSNHFETCKKMALHLFGSDKKNISLVEIKKCFVENIESQGGCFDSFEEIALRVEKDNSFEMYADKDGTPEIDIFKIRDAIVIIQKQCKTEKFPDPCGVIIKAIPGEIIKKGDSIFSFRCRNEFKKQFELLLKSCFTLNDSTKKINSRIEIIG